MVDLNQIILIITLNINGLNSLVKTECYTQLTPEQ